MSGFSLDSIDFYLRKCILEKAHVVSGRNMHYGDGLLHSLYSLKARNHQNMLVVE